MSFIASLLPIRHLGCTGYSRKVILDRHQCEREKKAADVGISLLLSLILLGFGTAVSAQEAIEQEFEFDIPRQAVDTACRGVC